MDIIMGFDPAVRGDAGWAILKTDGGYVNSGVISFDAKESLDRRLRTLYIESDRILTQQFHRYRIVALAVEMPPGKVSHPQRPDVPLILGQAVGVIRAVAYGRFLPVAIVYPSQAKAAVCSGMATKEQVQSAVQERFGLKELPGPDEAMAIAVTLAALEKLVEDGRKESTN